MLKGWAMRGALAAAVILVAGQAGEGADQIRVIADLNTRVQNGSSKARVFGGIDGSIVAASVEWTPARAWRIGPAESGLVGSVGRGSSGRTTQVAFARGAAVLNFGTEVWRSGPAFGERVAFPSDFAWLPHLVQTPGAVLAWTANAGGLSSLWDVSRPGVPVRLWTSAVGGQRTAAEGLVIGNSYIFVERGTSTQGSVFVVSSDAAGPVRRVAIPSIPLGLRLWGTTGSGPGRAFALAEAPGGVDLWTIDPEGTAVRVAGPLARWSVGQVRAAWGDAAFLWADGAGINGPQIRRLDGTGRRMEVVDGPPVGTVRRAVSAGGTLYVVDSVAGAPLRLLAADWDSGDFRTLLTDTRSVAASEPAASGGSIAFLLTGTGIQELWGSDGTREGTQQLTAGVSVPLTTPVSIGGRIVFSAIDLVAGEEPFVTDGTQAGTGLLADLVSCGEGCSNGSDPSGFLETPGGVVFSGLIPAGDRDIGALFVTPDGGKSSQLLLSLADVVPNYRAISSAELSPVELSIVGPVAGGAIFSVAGRLGVTDGTAAGTRLLEVTGVSAAILPDGRPLGLPLGGELVYVANSGIVRTDGTAAGTRTIAPAGPGRSVIAMQLFGDRLVHIQRASSSGPPNMLGATSLEGVARPIPGSPPRPSAIFVGGGVLYAVADDGDGSAVFASARAEEGFQAVATLPRRATPLAALDGRLVLEEPGPDFRTGRIVSVGLGGDVQTITNYNAVLGVVGDRVVFARGLAGQEWTIFSTGGRAADIVECGRVPAIGGYRQELRAVGSARGELYFAHIGIGSGASLWRTDGGEGRLRHVSGLGSVSTYNMTVAEADGVLYGGLSVGESGAEPVVIELSACLADIVGVGGLPPPDGGVTLDDYTAFINAFASDDLLADIVSIGGLPAPDLVLTVDDYTSFINAFAEGCG